MSTKKPATAVITSPSRTPTPRKRAEPESLTDAILRQIEALRPSIETLKITGESYLVQAADYRSALVDIQKKIDGFFDEKIARWHAGHKAELADKAKFSKPVKDFLALIDGEINQYRRRLQDEQDHLRREEEKRVRDQIESDREAEAQRLYEAGKLDEAAEVLQEPITISEGTLPPAVVDKTPFKSLGLSTPTLYSAELTDLMALCRAVLEGNAPQEAIQWSETFCNAQARALKREGVIYPGVKSVSRGSVRSTGR